MQPDASREACQRYGTILNAIASGEFRIEKGRVVKGSLPPPQRKPPMSDPLSDFTGLTAAEVKKALDDRKWKQEYEAGRAEREVKEKTEKARIDALPRIALGTRSLRSFGDAKDYALFIRQAASTSTDEPFTHDIVGEVQYSANKVALFQHELLPVAAGLFRILLDSPEWKGRPDALIEAFMGKVLALPSLGQKPGEEPRLSDQIDAVMQEAEKLGQSAVIELMEQLALPKDAP